MNGNVTGNGTYITATLVKDADELRDAITNAADGAVIALDDDIVLNDTLNIGKSITLDGNGHTISTTDISTQIPAVNGETINYSAIIAATNNAKVVLKDLVVKGDPEKASTDRDLTHDTRYIGVAAINADLTMEGCEILDITYTKGSDGLQGMQNGFGVYAVSNSAQTVTLNNTKIENFNKAAVIARDKINLIVNGCTITGFGEQAIIGQNGIQYAGNATIQNTKISGLVYNAENEWKNCSTAIYNVSTGTTTNTILQNVVCENVDSSYYDAVLWAVASGITNGTNAAGTTFSPDEPVTRAQAVTFQWRAAGAPAVSGSGFEDVAEDAYYAQSVIWAAREGITVGTNAAGTAFSPDVPVSRAQAVTFLYRELAD